MRKSILFIGVVFLVLSSYMSITSQPTGAPAAASGGPAEGNLTCTQSGCHVGNPTLVTNFITTDIPATGYIPGRAYNITVSFSGAGNKGFQLSAQDSLGNSKGSFTSGSGSKINNFGAVSYITHSAAKSPSPASWTFQWRAPARGSNRFAIYGAFATTRNTTNKQKIVTFQNPNIPIVTTLAPSSKGSSTATLSATANANTGAYNVSFQYKAQGGTWNFINALPAGITGDSLVPFSADISGLIEHTNYIYRACAWNKGDTTWADSVTFTTYFTGLAETKGIQEFTVYPQPASDYADLRFNLMKTSNVNVRIFTLTGDLAIEEEIGKMNPGMNQYHLPFVLSKGIYLIQVEAGGQSVTQKLLVQ